VPVISPADDAQVNDGIRALLPIFEMYIGSFFLIGFFWQMHHRLFNRIHYHDPGLIWLNLAYLLPITCMPFMSELVGRYREMVLPTVLYFGTLTATAAFQCLAWRHAVRRGLIAADLAPAEVRYLTFFSAVPLVVYAAGLGVAFIAPQASQRVYFLLLLAPFAKRQLMKA
jgi:uncharacterized membrane protein